MQIRQEASLTKLRWIQKVEANWSFQLALFWTWLTALHRSGIHKLPRCLKCPESSRHDHELQKLDFWWFAKIMHTNLDTDNKCWMVVETDLWFYFLSMSWVEIGPELLRNDKINSSPKRTALRLGSANALVWDARTPIEIGIVRHPIPWIIWISPKGCFPLSANSRASVRRRARRWIRVCTTSDAFFASCPGKNVALIAGVFGEIRIEIVVLHGPSACCVCHAKLDLDHHAMMRGRVMWIEQNLSDILHLGDWRSIIPHFAEEMHTAVCQVVTSLALFWMCPHMQPGVQRQSSVPGGGSQSLRH